MQKDDPIVARVPPQVAKLGLAEFLKLTLPGHTEERYATALAALAKPRGNRAQRRATAAHARRSK